MKETITRITCVLCHKTMNASSTPIRIPVIFHTDQTEGRGCAPYISMQELDLCGECTMQCTNLHGYGAQGYNEYSLRFKTAEEIQQYKA